MPKLHNYITARIPKYLIHHASDIAADNNHNNIIITHGKTLDQLSLPEKIILSRVF